MLPEEIKANTLHVIIALKEAIFNIQHIKDADSLSSKYDHHCRHMCLAKAFSIANSAYSHGRRIKCIR
ncbi:MAG: hypothetical protein WB443_12730 [Nitrososphaeraceae archaeon]